MKIIRSGLEEVALVHCSCCMEDHTVKFEVCKDNTYVDDDVLYIRVNDNTKWKFFSRIGRAFDFLINWKSYVDGKRITWNAILIKKKQLTELYNELKYYLLNNNKISNQDVTQIEGENKFLETTFPITWEGKNKQDTKDYTLVPFIGNNFVVSVDFVYIGDKEVIDNEIGFGFKLDDKTTFKEVLTSAWRYVRGQSEYYVGGHNESFVTKENTIKLLAVFFYFIHNLQD